MICESEGERLKQLAHQSIEYGINHGKPLETHASDYPEALNRWGACFVTLEINQQLRGCIGTLEPWRPLIDDITHNAYAAAFKDPRFPSLNQAEFEQIELSLSILGAPEPMHSQSEAELIQQLVVGRDGLILELDSRRATFLPSVWEQLPEPQEFLFHLKQKAGLSGDFWSPKLRFFRYGTQQI